jgi:hypothetical protein
LQVVPDDTTEWNPEIAPQEVGARDQDAEETETDRGEEDVGRQVVPGPQQVLNRQNRGHEAVGEENEDPEGLGSQARDLGDRRGEGVPEGEEAEDGREADRSNGHEPSPAPPAAVERDAGEGGDGQDAPARHHDLGGLHEGARGEHGEDSQDQDQRDEDEDRKEHPGPARDHAARDLCDGDAPVAH